MTSTKTRGRLASITENPRLGRRRSSYRTILEGTTLLAEEAINLTVYLSRRSVPCRLVWLYLLQTKTAFNLVDTDDGVAEAMNSVSDVNPNGTIPCLEDGDVVVFDCPAMIFYLAEKYTGHAEMGPTRKIRAKAEAIMCWASSTLLRNIHHDFISTKVGKQEFDDPEVNTELGKLVEEDVVHHLETLEKIYLKTNPYLLGADPLFVDSYIAMIITLLDLASFNMKPYPKVKQWIDRVKKHNGDNWEDVCEVHNLQVIQRGSRRASFM
ncbi:glutathione S-transferase 1-like [Lineus longissimus]|uniref:glutathione S-transferase 1-like n=1 Tax=Lineus longissimus TaxID=88925 RepID=UPI002B4F5190